MLPLKIFLFLLCVVVVVSLFGDIIFMILAFLIKFLIVAVLLFAVWLAFKLSRRK